MVLYLGAYSLVVILQSFQIYYLHPFEISVGLLLPFKIFLAVNFLLLLFGQLSWLVNMFHMPLVDMRLFLVVLLLCIDIPLLIYVEWVPVHVLISLSWLDFADRAEILLKFTTLFLQRWKHLAVVVFEILITSIFQISLNINLSRYSKASWTYWLPLFNSMHRSQAAHSQEHIAWLTILSTLLKRLVQWFSFDNGTNLNRLIYYLVVKTFLLKLKVFVLLLFILILVEWLLDSFLRNLWLIQWPLLPNILSSFNWFLLKLLVHLILIEVLRKPLKVWLGGCRLHLLVVFFVSHWFSAC